MYTFKSWRHIHVTFSDTWLYTKTKDSIQDVHTVDSTHSAYFKGLTIIFWLVRRDRVIYVYFFMLILKIKFLKFLSFSPRVIIYPSFAYLLKISWSEPFHKVWKIRPNFDRPNLALGPRFLAKFDNKILTNLYSK